MKRALDMVSDGARGWQLALAAIEFTMQAMGLVVIGQVWMGDLKPENGVELTVALLSFFIMNLETSYDLNEEKMEAILYPRVMLVFYWLTLVLMTGSTYAAGLLSLLSMLQLKNVTLNKLRILGLLCLGLPTLVHLLYRLALVLLEQYRIALLVRSYNDSELNVAQPGLEGPNSSDLEE